MWGLVGTMRSDMELTSQSAHPVQQRAHGRAGSPALVVVLGDAAVGRAGDVEVRPGGVAGEVREERAAGRRTVAVLAAVDVAEVGELALHLLLVAVPQR